MGILKQRQSFAGPSHYNSLITVHVSSGACVMVTDRGCCASCCSPAYTTIRPLTIKRSPGRVREGIRWGKWSAVVS